MDSIQVAVRVRPLINRELNSGLQSGWKVHGKAIAENRGNSTPYVFDNVFDMSVTTEEVYNAVAKPILEGCMKGFHGTIFAYGQTSSGKTHTMMGNTQNGIIPMSLKQIFQSIENSPEQEFLLRVSYMEIYNENLSDLLTSNKNKPLKIMDSSGVVGLEEIVVTSCKDVTDIMKRGEAKRHIGETNMNERSSRSHTIFRMIIESLVREDDNSDGVVNVAHLNLVDLAGSERLSQTGASGSRLREGCHINRSLFMLGQCINQLSDNPNAHVNFRDSKLTRILQNALGGNSKTAIICNISPAAIEETHSTLKFASSAKRIKNKPVINEVLSDEALLKRYKKEITNLKKKIETMQDTDVHMEKEDLEQKLQERDVKIEHLKKLMCVSSITSMPPPAPGQFPMKKRRETWCPGKLQKLSSLTCKDSTAGLLMPMRIKTPQSLRSNFVCARRPLEPLNTEYLNQSVDLGDTSFQTLSDVSSVFNEAEDAALANQEFVTPKIDSRKRCVHFSGIDEKFDLSPRCQCHTKVPELKDRVSEFQVTVRKQNEEIEQLKKDLSLKEVELNDLTSFTKMELDNSMSAKKMEILEKLTQEKEELTGKVNVQEKKMNSQLNQITDLTLEKQYLEKAVYDQKCNVEINLRSLSDGDILPCSQYADNTSLEEQKSNLDIKLEALTNALASAEQDKMLLQETVEKLKKELQDQNFFVSDAARQIEEAWTQMKIAINEKEDAERNLAEVEIQKEFTDRQLMRYEKEIAATRQQNEEVTCNITENREDLEMKFRELQDQLSMASSEREILDVERLGLQNEKDTLERDLVEFHVMMMNYEQLQGKNDELVKLATELEAELNKNIAEVDENKSKKSQMESTIDDLQVKVSVLEECNSDLHVKVNLLEETLENKNNQHGALLHEKDEIALKLKSMIDNAAVAQSLPLGAEISMAESNDLLQKNEGDSDAGVRQFELQEHIKGLVTSNEELQCKIGNYEATIEKGKGMILQMNSEKEKLFEELDYMDDENKILLQEKTDLQEKLNNLEIVKAEFVAEMENLKASFKEVVDEKGDIEDRFERLIMEKEDLEMKYLGNLSVSSDHKDSALEELESVKEKNRKIEADQKSTQKELEALNEFYTQCKKSEQGVIQKLQIIESEKRELEIIICDHESQIESLVSCKNDLEGKCSDADLLFQKQSELQSAIDSLLIEKNNLVATNEMLKSDKDERMQALNNKTAEQTSLVAQQNENIDNLRAEKDELLTQNKVLEQHIIELSKTGESESNSLLLEVDRLKDNIATKENEKSSIKEEYEDKHKALVSEMEQYVSGAQGDYKVLEDEKNRFLAEVLDLQRERSQQDSVIDDLRRRIEENISQFKTLTEERDHLFTEKSALTAEIEQLHLEAINLQEVNSASVNATEKLRTELESSEVYKNQIIAEFETIKYDLDAEILCVANEKKNLEQLVITLEDRISELETEKSDLNFVEAKCDQRVCDAESAKQKVEKEFDDLKSEKSKITLKMDQLTSEIETLHKSINYVNQEKAEIMETVCNLKQKNANFALESQKSMDTITTYDTEIKKLKEQLKISLSTGLNESIVVDPNNALDLTIRLEKKSKYVERLEKENEKLEAIIDEVDSEIDEVKAKNQELEVKLSQAGEHDQLLKQKEVYVESLEKEIDKLKDIIDKVDGEIDEVKAKKQELEADLMAKDIIMQRSDRTIANNEKEMEKLYRIIDDVDNEIEQEKKKSASLQEQIDKLQGCNQDVKTKELKEEAQKLQVENIQLEMKIREGNADKDRELKFLRGENNFMTDNIRRLKDEIRRRYNDQHDTTVLELKPQPVLNQDSGSLSGSGIVDSAVICSLQSNLKESEHKIKRLELTVQKDMKKMKFMKQTIFDLEGKICTYARSFGRKEMLTDVTNTTSAYSPVDSTVDGSPAPEISPLSEVESAASGFDPANYLKPIKSTKPSDYYYMLYGKESTKSPRRCLEELLEENKQPPREPKKKQTIGEMIAASEQGNVPDCASQ